MAPVCPGTFNFINEFGECVAKNWCDTYYKCPTAGSFNEEMNGCFCSNVVADPLQYCDSVCEKESLKAYIDSTGTIILEAGSDSMRVDPIEFGDSVDVSGIACQDKCLLGSIGNT
jgi:hypothetical protein